MSPPWLLITVHCIRQDSKVLPTALQMHEWSVSVQSVGMKVYMSSADRPTPLTVKASNERDDSSTKRM